MYCNSDSNYKKIDMETDILQKYSISATDYEIRTENLNGRQHIVVPVIMIKEGVHHGSGGPILHRSEGLSQNIQSWNGIPVTIGHPESEGNNVSAQSPEILEQFSVGRIFNARFEDDSVRAEAWLDVQRMTAMSPLALEYIKEKRALDVSVGVFSNSDPTEGEWQGETYEAVALDYRPDHLALLPGERGACSWNDGCGIRVNKEGGKVDLLKTLKELNQKGFAVAPINNEEGFQEISQLLQSALNAMDTNTKYFYLEEVFANEFVYRVRDADGGSNLYRRGYAVNNGAVALAETPSEVRKKVDYVTMQMRRTKKPIINDENKGGKMTKVATPCCEAKVDALIANASTRWKAEDREWLLAQEATVIDKFSPMELKPEEIQANSEEVLDTFKSTLKTVEDYTALMPEAMKAQVEKGVTLYTEQRESLVKTIIDNTDEGTWTEEGLKAMNDGTLQSISKSIKVPTDYSGQAASGTVNKAGKKGEVAPMLPAGVGDKS